MDDSSHMILAMDASLQPLFDTLSTLEFEEYGWLAVTAVMLERDDVILHLEVHQQNQSDQFWRIRCSAVRRSTILNSHRIDNLRIETEHPLLLPHTEPKVELYISSRPSNADVVVGQLVEAHREVVENWFDFPHFFNLGPRRSLRAMLEGGLGLLAEGPQPLIERYANVLRRAGVAVSSPPSRPPVWWDGSEWVKEEKPLFAVILGASHVVAQDVTAERG
jgi:hypothetical protein